MRMVIGSVLVTVAIGWLIRRLCSLLFEEEIMAFVWHRYEVSVSFLKRVHVTDAASEFSFQFQGYSSCIRLSVFLFF